MTLTVGGPPPAGRRNHRSARCSTICADPKSLDGLAWLACYLTTGKHMLFYASVGLVLLLLPVTAPVALAMGFAGALARAVAVPAAAAAGQGLHHRWCAGVPDIVFFMFFVIALDQGLEYLRHKIKCPRLGRRRSGRAGLLVCAAAKLPLSSAPQWVHETYGFTLAVLTIRIVFGAFAANVLLRCHARRAARPDRDRRGLRHDRPPGLLAGAGAADVGLCPARPVEPVDDPDQGHAAAVPARASRTSSTGRASWAARRRRPSATRMATGGLATSSALLVFYLR